MRQSIIINHVLGALRFQLADGMNYGEGLRMLKRRCHLTVVFGATLIYGLVLGTLSESQSARAAPNFVLVLTDDQGWTGTSVPMHPDRDDSRSDFHLTPNLERLARGGMRFSQGYSPAAICSPTRRSIQFGQTPARQGEARFADNYPPTPPRVTIPRILKSVDSRYRAAHFGKWDLRAELLPEHLGYDQSDGNTGNRDGNVGSAFSKQDKWRKHKVLEDPKRIFTVTARANEFMEEQVLAGRPFFLQVSHYAVHADTQTTDESLQESQQRDQGKIHRRTPFAAMTADLDNGLGQLLDKIEALGIKDSTYIFYLADNGAVPWVPPNKPKHFAPPPQHGEVSNNYPLRGGKWTLFEGGIRVPWIVAGPGVTANSWCPAPVVGWDLLPTIADLAGSTTPLPEDTDGGSLRALLENEGEGAVTRASPGLVFHRYSNGEPHSAIRVGDYKLIKFWKPTGLQNDPTNVGSTYEQRLLFNLRLDLQERHNLARAEPTKVRELEELLNSYLERVDAEILQ